MREAPLDIVLDAAPDTEEQLQMQHDDVAYTVKVLQFEGDEDTVRRLRSAVNEVWSRWDVSAQGCHPWEMGRDERCERALEAMAMAADAVCAGEQVGEEVGEEVGEGLLTASQLEALEVEQMDQAILQSLTEHEERTREALPLHQRPDQEILETFPCSVMLPILLRAYHLSLPGGGDGGPPAKRPKIESQPPGRDDDDGGDDEDQKDPLPESKELYMLPDIQNDGKIRETLVHLLELEKASGVFCFVSLLRS